MEPLGISDEDMSQLTGALRKFDFFRDLTMSELDDVLRYVKLFGFKAGEVIFKKGDPGDALYVLNDGKAKVFIKEGFFKPAKLLGYVNPGEVFGEMALLDSRRRSATVECMTPTKAFSLLRSSFDGIREKNQSFEEKIKKVVERRRKENQQVE